MTDYKKELIQKIKRIEIIIDTIGKRNDVSVRNNSRLHKTIMSLMELRSTIKVYLINK